MRYTIHYLFQGKEHTMQFPAPDDESAKEIAEELWAVTSSAMNNSFGELPVFERLEPPLGFSDVDWKPTP